MVLVTPRSGTRQRCRILDAKDFILDQEVSGPCAGIPCDAHEPSFTFQDSIHLLESVIAADRGKSSLTFPDNPMLGQVLLDARVLLLQPKHCTNVDRYETGVRAAVESKEKRRKVLERLEVE